MVGSCNVPAGLVAWGKTSAGTHTLSNYLENLIHPNCPGDLIYCYSHCLQYDNIEEWDSSSFPAGAHFVNVQRGTKGFGILLVEQKVEQNVLVNHWL